MRTSPIVVVVVIVVVVIIFTPFVGIALTPCKYGIFAAPDIGECNCDKGLF